MDKLSKKILLDLATQQGKLTREFKIEIEKYFARYALRIITEEELMQALHLS